MSERPDIWKVADALMYDLVDATARLNELRSMLVGLDLPDPRPACPTCGYRAAMNLPSVAEHIEHAHPELKAV